MKYLTGTWLLCILLCACGEHKPPAAVAQPVSDTAKFFPLESFFRSQIEYVDLRNFTIYRVSVINGHKDSVGMDKDAFRQWAQVFLERAFSDPAQKARYRETVFEDRSTASYTLNYAPYDAASVTVKNIDVLLSQETNIVKRIFIRSSYQKGDTTIDEQCNWKADKSFQLNRTKTIGNQTITEMNTVSWNDF